MKTSKYAKLQPFRAAFGPLVLAALALFAAPASALTDLTSTPLNGSSAAQVKPNIMLLMDASNSMGWGHMPDEVETITGYGSVGYKSAQCNVLYYNPAQKYAIPRKEDGTFFPTPLFASAPYAGFVSYYSVADKADLPDGLNSSTVNLGTSFKAYDRKMLFQTFHNDTPQAAYYFTYTGTQTPNYATAPCTDHDGTAPGAATVAATGGGTWNKIIVGATSGPGATDERTNFAIWYSFYRTRISLIKSAASLAFTPLTDSFRVGFITVEPKDSPGATTINPIRYVPLADFDTTQRGVWFSKLFSQSPFGASPAREGLARVGRYYGNKRDGINAGMDGPDPMQYSCQQNFTIMTTDGYWNAQTETPTSGTTYGGPLQLDGVHTVDQQDGDAPAPAVSCPVTDPYCMRPIYDGAPGSSHVDTDVSTLYSDQSCGLSTRMSSTYTIMGSYSQVLKTTTSTSLRTQYYTASSSQDMATTKQMTVTQSQVIATTLQYVTATTQYVEDRYQVMKSQDNTTTYQEQWKQQKIQYKAQTSQVSKVVKQTTESSSQARQTTKQFVTTTTQFAQYVQQYKLGTVQTQKHQYQTLATDSSQEREDAIPGTCVQAGTITCSTNEMFGPAFVDPATCTQGVGPGPDYVKTDCTPGPLTAAVAPVASCTVGVTTPVAPNYTVSTCTLTTTTPQAPISSCTVGTVTGASPNYYVTTCLKPAGVTNATTAVSSCTLGTTAATSPNWITTVCSNPAGPNNLASFVASCTDGTVAGSSPNYVSVTCDHTSANNFAPKFQPPCTTTAGVSPNFISITCSTATLSNAVVDPATCSVGNTGSPSYQYTTCPSAFVAPDLVPTLVNSATTCTGGVGSTTGAGPTYIVTVCTAGPSNAAAAPIASCTVGTVAGTSPNWITTICTKPIDTSASPVPSPPCTTSTAPVTLIKTTCSAPVITMPATAVDPTTCPLVPGTTTLGVSPYTVTHCVKNPLAPLGGICVSGNSGPPNYIQRDCNLVTGGGPVPFCNVGTTNSGPPNYITTVCSTNNFTGNVPTCANSGGSSPNYIAVSCGPVTTVSGPTPIDPVNCADGTVGPGPTYYTTHCSALTPVIVTPTAVASCPSDFTGPGPNFYVTTCSHPTATNFSNNVASCTVGSVAKSPPNYIATSCVYTDVTTAAPGPAPTYCTNQTATSPAWTTLTCTTIPGAFTNTPVPPLSCVGDPNTTCTPTGTLGTVAVGSCPTSPGASPTYYVWNCASTTPTTPVPDPTCLDGTGPGPGFLQTHCSTAAGTGYLRVKTTTTKITTTAWSGAAPGAPTGLPPTISSSSVGPTQVDGICNSAPEVFPNPNPQVVPTVTVINPLPGGSLNSLADVSQYYYKTDLRSDLANNVKVIGAGPEGDFATHQHMTTFVVGLGVSGTLNYVPNYRSVPGDYADIKAGLKVWPVWPDSNINFTTPDPDGVPPWTSGPNAYGDKRSIDDFWHTAVNGRGTYFSAANPTSVISGLSGALAGIQAALASSTGQGISSLQPVAGNNFIYSATYTTAKWTGDVVANTINLSDGSLDQPPLWSAQALLNTKTKALCDNRTIYLARSTATNGMVPFTWNTDTCVAGSPSGLLDTQINATEQLYFGSTYVQLLSQYPQMTDGTAGSIDQRTPATTGDKLVNYVRGQRGYEPFSDQANTLFRQRDSILGDIVDSQPVYVQAPFAAYTDPGYDTFRSSNSGRTPMIYVGANDGMLHAFYAGVDATDPQRGQEAWAIIPSAVLPNLFKLADNSYANIHQFYVDGTPAVGDVYDTATSTWRTIVITGLNDGGKEYFAVDVTNPTSPKTLWEFKWNPTCPASLAAAVGNTSDCHLGYTYGAPVITKLANGTWVALVTSGYNNVNTPSVAGDGVGYLYVLNAMTGVIISKISTGAGLDTNPSGFAQINNYVENSAVNNTTQRVYGGDLLGNIWRIDVNAPSVTLLGTATELTTGLPQPITVRPELAELNNIPIVMVGTGRLLGTTDVPLTQGQSIYGITDPLTAGTVYSDLRGAMKPLVLTTTGVPPTATRTVACAPTAIIPDPCLRTAGWVVDFPNAIPDVGERVNVQMQLTLGTLVVASNVPGGDVCDSGGHSWINFLDFSTGLSVSTSPGQIVSQYFSNSLTVGLGVIGLAQAGLPNSKYIGEAQGAGGLPPLQVVIPVRTLPPVGKRVSWREIAQ